MKLLFDENLSPRLTELLAAEFPGSTHLDTRACAAPRTPRSGRMRATMVTPSYPRTTISGSTRFSTGRLRRWSGWLVGNAGTAVIARLLANRTAEIEDFGQAPEQSLLVVEERV